MIAKILSLKMFSLLLALIILILLSPIIEMYGAQYHRLLFAIVSTILLLSAVIVVAERRIGRIVAVVLGAIWILLTWFRLLSETINAALIADLVLILMLFYVLSVLVRHTIRLEETDFDSLCGAVAAYFLIATAWAVSYRVIETLAPGSFAFNAGGQDAIASHFIYFSLTTITTLGYGDVTPVTPIARIWATLEAAAGVLYVALLIARLMSIYRR